jgi:cell division protein FtsW (lipid II flippase)
MGLGPLTGVPLPFLSYGGRYTISLMIALALVQRVAIESNKTNKKKKIKNQKIQIIEKE